MEQPLPASLDLPDPPAFEPVPSSSTRHDGWKPHKQRAFIAALSVMGSVTAAARAVGMTSRSAYKLRARPDAASFAAAWDEALDMGRQRAFDLAIERAIHGVTTPRYYRGKQVGTRHRYDHRLLMAALAAPAPPQQSCAMERVQANFGNFEQLLDSLTDPLDPPCPSP